LVPAGPAAAADRRGRLPRLAVHPGPVLRGHRRPTGRDLPRDQRKDHRHQPVERVPQDRHPAGPCRGQRPAAGGRRLDPAQQPDQGRVGGDRHPARLHLPACQRQPGRLGGAQAQAAFRDQEGQRQEGPQEGHAPVPAQAGHPVVLLAVGRLRVTAAQPNAGPTPTGPMGQARPTPTGPVGPAVPRPIPLPPGRRQTELLMLIFAIGVVLAAYAATGLGLNGRLPAGIAGYGVAFAALMLAAHFAVRRLAPWADPLLLPLAALLNGLGIVMIYRLQQSGRHGNPGIRISTIHSTTVFYQVIWSAIGIAAFVAVLLLVRETRVLQRYTYTFGA